MLFLRRPLPLSAQWIQAKGSGDAVPSAAAKAVGLSGRPNACPDRTTESLECPERTSRH